MRDKRQMVPAVGLLATGSHRRLHGDPAEWPGNSARQPISPRPRPPRCGTPRDRWFCADSSCWPTRKTTTSNGKAVLKPTGVDADAAGEAEVEFSKAAPATQEIEFFVVICNRASCSPL